MKIHLSLILGMLIPNFFFAMMPRALTKLPKVKQGSTAHKRYCSFYVDSDYHSDYIDYWTSPSIRDFFALPAALQNAYQERSYPGAHFDLCDIIYLVQNRKKAGACYHTVLPLLVWRMIQNQGISYQTAEHILTNLNRLSLHKPMIDNNVLDWEQEKQNKLDLIGQLNCKRVQERCAQNVDSHYSVLLQEFVHAQQNPYTSLVFEKSCIGPMVNHAARCMKCCNVKAFDIKRPGFTYHEEENHQFCSE